MAGREVEFYNHKFETMGRDELYKYQFELFLRQLKKVYQKNSFYRQKFKEAGIEPGDIKTPDDIRRIPTTTKKEVLADIRANQPYGNRLQVRREEIVGVAETSGTTGGEREVYALAAADYEAVLEMETTGFFWAGVRPGDVVINTIPMSTSAAGIWYYNALLKLSPNVFQVGTFDSRKKVSYMARYGCKVLISSPSYLKRLEVAAEEMGIKPADEFPMKTLLVAGEPFTVQWALEREQKWGAKLYEQYGCTQRAVAWSCEYGAVVNGERGVLHTLPHITLYEIVRRDTGEYVGPYEEGELIITPLHAEASPLIRFATNDRVKFIPAGHCPCGRPYDGLEAGSITRYDFMMKIKMVSVWPEAVDEIVFSFPEVLEYRGEVRIDEGGKEEAHIYLEMKPSTQPESKRQIMEKLGHKLRSRIGIRFSIEENLGPSLLVEMKEGLEKKKRWQDGRLK